MSEEIKPNNNLNEEKTSTAGQAAPFAGKQRKYLRLVLIFAAIVFVGAAISFAAPYFFPQKQLAQTNSPTPDEIVITQLPNGNQLVENKTENVSLQLSSTSFVDGTNRQFYNSASDGNCKISFDVTLLNNNDQNIKDIESAANKNLADLGLTVVSNTYQIIQVSGYSALRENLLTAENGYSSIVNIPVGGKLYSYVLYSNPKNTSTCNTYLDNVLKSVAINK
ncbi:MAG: hypothetical protein M1334_00340 [Patescibacteria group bacterium]|nr:hypothetical protein [Patescibacteria group bacterium]